MIRHKAMFKVFFIITALYLGTPSEAGINCTWCDYELLRSFMGCCTQRMAKNPNFKTCSTSMEEMKTDLLDAAKGMTKDGPTKENLIKGAMGYLIATCISGTDGNPDNKISDTRNILKRCYRDVNKKPDDVYIKEVLDIIKDKLEEKGNPSNVQQPKKETQSDEIPQAGQDTSPSQYNNSPPLQVEANPNQGKNQWNGPYDKTQQQGQNFQPNQWNGPYDKTQQQGQNFQPNQWNGPYDKTQQQGQHFQPNQWNGPYDKTQQQGQNFQPNQWNGPYDKTQQQGQNFQPNPSQGSANNFALSQLGIPYGTFQQPPGLTNNGYLKSASQNQPFNPSYTYNQGNPYAYPNANQKYLSNPGNSNTGVSAASLSYASNELQNQKGYNTPYASSFASAASPPAYNYAPQNYDNNPNSPAFNAAAVSSASSSATNYGGNNAASSSSGSYLIANSDQKPFPFNSSNRKGKQKLPIPINKPQSEGIWPPPQNQQNKWDSNPNLNPVMPNTPITQPELVKTSSVPQQTSPTATQNVAQENNWKLNNQKNVPSTKDDEDDKYARAMKLAETLYIGLIKNKLFPKYFHQFTTKEQLKTLVSYIIYDSLSSCGYDEKTTQGLATSSISFMDGFPVSSPTPSYVEAFCQMIMVLFHKHNLIGDDPQGQAEALVKAMSEALKKIESPPPLQYNDAKPVVLPAPEQNLPDYPTKRVPYDDSNANYYAANPEVKPDSFSNKQLNQPLDLQNKGSDYPFSQTLPIQKQKNHPDVYDVNDQLTDDKAISYDKSRNIKNKKKADQSYADSDDKIVYGSDDNDHDVFPGQWQNQKQKNQPNTNDNNDQSPDDEPISYDKTIKNKSDKKGDQSYVDDKTVYSSYNDKNQPSNDKQNKKGNPSYLGSTGKDNDYGDGSRPYGYYDDNGTYVYDDYYYDNYPGEYDEDGDINPNYLLGYTEKEQSPRNDYNNIDKSKYKPKQQPDILIQKDDSKTNKQGYNNPDTYNVPDDNSKKILISKTLEQQKDNSNPLYLPDYDKYGAQKPSKQPLPLPPIADDQQNSKLPDIGQENFSTAPIKPETLKNSDLALNPDKQTDLSTDAPVFQPDISDSSTNPDLNKAKNDDSKARVEILKKWTLNCMKGEKFDYNTYAGVIARLDKMVQQEHPDWPQQKSQTTVLIETIFALTQLLLKSNVKEVKDIIQQPQKIVEPVQLPPNSQWNNQNVPQKNQNPNYQPGQANKNSQPGLQDKPADDYLAPEQNIAYSSQNQGIQQNKWGNNQNPAVQNTLRPQSKPNANYAPQPNIPIATQPSAQNNNWDFGNQGWQKNDRQIPNNKENSQNQGIQQNKWGSNQNPVVQNTLPQSKPTNANYPPQQNIPIATQPSAQNNNLNVGNQGWQSNDRQITNNKGSSLQVQQPPPIPGQFNTNQGNGKPQIMNSNAGISDINNFQQTLGNQANLPGLQQKPNNAIFLQNWDQGRDAQSGAIARSGQSENQVFMGVRDNKPPTPKGLNNPFVNGNQAPAVSRPNWSPMQSGPSSANLNQPFTWNQDNWSPEIANAPKMPILVPNGNQGAEALGNWPLSISNIPIKPSLEQNINQAFVQPWNNWAPSNPISPRNGNQGNRAVSQQNDFMNPGIPGIGGVNQAVNYHQMNQ